MDEHEENDSFEEMVRAIAEEVGRSIEHVVGQVDLDDVAETLGVDPDRAREWMDAAGSWLRARAAGFGEEFADRAAHAQGFTHPPDSAPDPDMTGAEDALKGAGPHPLDLPSEEQGIALAALASGRWTLERGSEAFAAHGDGPGPRNALGLVRELRVRDWVNADGELTPVGLHALDRWLNASGHQ